MSTATAARRDRDLPDQLHAQQRRRRGRQVLRLRLRRRLLGRLRHVGQSHDPTVKLDLNKTWNWNVNYAYDATLTNTAIKYTNVLGSGPGTTGGNNRFYDPWAQEIQKVSNAYGYSYTDLVSSGGVNPQITLWDPSANGGAGGNVSTINITLYSNSETLPSTSGFQSAPAVYIAPTHTSYTAANTPTQGNVNELGFAFQFGLGSPAVNFAPNGQTPAVFKFYAPSDPSAGTDGFVSLAVPVLSGHNASTNTAESSIWNILTVQGGPGHWSLVSNAGSNPYSQQDGQFNIYNVPVTSDGTTGWYELVFGGDGAQTVYNIYAANNGGVFKPIAGAGASAANFVIDHGVDVTQAPHPGYYTLNFAPGGAMTYSIDTFSAPGTTSGTTGSNPPNGTGGNDASSGSGGSGLKVLGGAIGFDAALGTIRLASAAGANHDGAPHASSAFSLANVTASFEAGHATDFHLKVDAGVARRRRGAASPSPTISTATAPSIEPRPITISPPTTWRVGRRTAATAGRCRQPARRCRTWPAGR